MEISPLIPGLVDDKVTKSSATFAQDFDTFLLLLTTQLQNQDPLSPLDATQFTQQLAQFTEVEQSIATNTKLSELIALQQANQVLSAAGFVGKSVEALGDQVPLIGGSAEMFYAPSAQANETTITIFNAAGDPVRTIAGETTPEKHQFIWDGKDQSDNAVPDGNYSFNVVSRNIEGQLIDVDTSFVGDVVGLSSESGSLVLNVNGIEVPLDELISIREPSA